MSDGGFLFSTINYQLQTTKHTHKIEITIQRGILGMWSIIGKFHYMGNYNY